MIGTNLYGGFGCFVDLAVDDRQAAGYELQQCQTQGEAAHYAASDLQVSSQHLGATSVVDVVR